MPAKSEKQQQFFGIVRSIQKGEQEPSGKAGEVAKDMDPKDVKKFAETKHEGLPVSAEKTAGYINGYKEARFGWVAPTGKAIWRHITKGPAAHATKGGRLAGHATDVGIAGTAGVTSGMKEYEETGDPWKGAVQGIANAALLNPYFIRGAGGATLKEFAKKKGDPMGVISKKLLVPVAAKLGIPYGLDIMRDTRDTMKNLEGVTSSASDVSKEVAGNVAKATKDISSAAAGVPDVVKHLETSAKGTGDTLKAVETLSDTLGKSTQDIAETAKASLATAGRGVGAVERLGGSLEGLGDLGGTLAGMMKRVQAEAGNPERQKQALLGVAALLTLAGGYKMATRRGRPRSVRYYYGD